jgi:hypothetical protein
MQLFQYIGIPMCFISLMSIILAESLVNHVIAALILSKFAIFDPLFYLIQQLKDVVFMENAFNALAYIII